MKYASICSQSADGGDRRSRPAEPAHTLRLLDLLFAGLACGRPYGAVRRRRTPKTVRRRARPGGGAQRRRPAELAHTPCFCRSCSLRARNAHGRTNPGAGGRRSGQAGNIFRFSSGVDFPVRNMKLASSGSFGFGDGHHQVMVVPLAVR